MAMEIPVEQKEKKIRTWNKKKIEQEQRQKETNRHLDPDQPMTENPVVAAAPLL